MERFYLTAIEAGRPLYASLGFELIADLSAWVYASHIASTLDAAAINVRKPKPAKRLARKERAADAA